MKKLMWLLLATAGVCQVTPTHIRSVTSLPGTCIAGNGSSPTDIVSLSSGGLSILNYCKATNTFAALPAKSTDNVFTGVNTFPSLTNLTGNYMTLLPASNASPAKTLILDGSQGFLQLQADAGAGASLGGQLNLQSVNGPNAAALASLLVGSSGIQIDATGTTIFAGNSLKTIITGPGSIQFGNVGGTKGQATFVGNVSGSQSLLCLDATCSSLQASVLSIGNITGLTQCLSANSAGLISGTGVPCGGLALRTNGTLNGSQTLLNLVQGSGITITDNGSGTDTFACPTCILGSGLTSGVVPVYNGSQSVVNSNYLSISSSAILLGVGCATVCTGGALTLQPYTGTNIAASLSDNNGDALFLGNRSASHTANINLSNTDQTSGFINTSGSTTYVYGSNLYLGVNGSPGSFSTPTKGFQISTSGTQLLGNLIDQYGKLRCETGLGDGLNAITAGTYLQFFCVNDSGVTWTITGIRCWTDNAGTSTLNAANNAATGLLTGAVTCNNTKASGGAAGTQSGTTTLASGDAISFTFVADGTSKQTTWSISLTQ